MKNVIVFGGKPVISSIFLIKTSDASDSGIRSG